MESSLSVAGLGLVILLLSHFEAGLWADESMDGVEPNAVEWLKSAGVRYLQGSCVGTESRQERC